MSDTITVNITTTPTTVIEIEGLGPQGAPGIGVPTGGTTGQILAKASNTDYDTQWVDGGGSGTVTSVSVTTANGVSGTVDDPTTTPAISLILGDITPSSVAATGTVTASNLSGINTGDTISATTPTTLTGYMRGDGSNVSAVSTIPNTDITGLGTASIQNATAFCQTANNLSDVANATTARTNLGLGTASTHATTDFLQVANNLNDVNNAGTARTNLGLGSLATKNTASLTSDVTGTLPIANGGTGQTGANAAFNALVPSQTGNSGKYLTTNATNTSWASVNAPMSPTFALALGTPATTGTNVTNALIAPRAGTISKAWAYAKTGPTGSALIFDILLNGTSIWNTNPTNRLQIAGGSQSGNQTSFDTTTVSTGDVLTINIAQVGSTIAGQDITVTLYILATL